MSPIRKLKVLLFLDERECKESQLSLLDWAFSPETQQQVHFEVLTTTYSGPIVKILEERRIPFEAVPLSYDVHAHWLKRGFKLLAYYKKLFRYLSMFEFDAIHTGGMRTNLLSVPIKIRFNLPLIWTLEVLALRGFKLWSLAWLVSVFSDHVVATSLYASHQLGRSKSWRNLVSVVYRGLADKKAIGMATSTSKELLLLAHLDSSAGASSFLHGVSAIRKEATYVKALIHAPGLEAAIGNAVVEQQLTTSVSFSTAHTVIGLFEQVKNQKGLVVFVNSSTLPTDTTDGIIEAMSYKVPVVASRCGSAPELIVHRMTGLLYSAGDPGALAEAILELEKESKLRATISEGCKTEFSARFSLSRYAGDMLGIYHQIRSKAEAIGLIQPQVKEVSRDESTKKAA